MDFEEEIKKILEVIPRERRTLLFSATMTSKVAKLQKASLVNPVKIEVSNKFQTPKVILKQNIILKYLFYQYLNNFTIYYKDPCSAILVSSL